MKQKSKTEEQQTRLTYHYATESLHTTFFQPEVIWKAYE